MIDLKHLSDNQLRAVWELQFVGNDESAFALGRIQAAMYDITGANRDEVSLEDLVRAIRYENTFRNFKKEETGFVFIKAFGDWDYVGGFIDNKEKFMKLMERIHESIMKRQREAVVANGDFTKGGLVPAGTYATDGNQPTGDPEVMIPADKAKGLLGNLFPEIPKPAYVSTLENFLNRKKE